MGNLYGRIRREGQASRLFGMYSKSMFGWVMMLVVLWSLCLAVICEIWTGLLFPRKRARASRPDGSDKGKELSPRPQIASVRDAGWDEQLVSTGAWRREFRKLSTAQRQPSRPSIAVLTRSLLALVLESRSDPVSNHIYHPLLVTPRPSWYAYLSLFIPPHSDLRMFLAGHAAHVYRSATLLESCPWIDWVEGWSPGNERQDCGSNLRHCSQIGTRLFYTYFYLTQLRSTVFSSSFLPRQRRCLDWLHHCSRRFS